MAVYTKLTDNKLKDFFSKYNLGKVISFSGIKEGIENTNYLQPNPKIITNVTAK